LEKNLEINGKKHPHLLRGREEGFCPKKSQQTGVEGTLDPVTGDTEKRNTILEKRGDFPSEGGKEG